MYNVLFTSAGRRSYLVQYFRQALKGQGSVICANMYPDAPAMYAADLAFVTPPAHDSSYVSVILDLCLRNNVKLLFSLHDLDVYVLSQHQREFQKAGVVAVLPCAHWGRVALDKYESTVLLQQNGFNVPWTSIDLSDSLSAINQGSLRLPVIVKARMGFGSLGLRICYTVEELRRAYDTVLHRVCSSGINRSFAFPETHSVLIQQVIKGKEYCIDVVNDLNGCYVCHFICEIHAMRAGESDKATTVDPVIAGDIPFQLSTLTRHKGIWGIDCMNDQGVLRVIDINPRFTGDYPFHQLAGANIPAALLAWAQGNEVDPKWLEAKAGVRGYKELVPTLVP